MFDDDTAPRLSRLKQAGAVASPVPVSDLWLTATGQRARAAGALQAPAGAGTDTDDRAAAAAEGVIHT